MNPSAAGSTFLLRYSDNGVERTHHLRPGSTLIGRLPSCDLTIGDASVSRHHARLTVTDDRCKLEDAGSRFGTFRNGTRVLDPVDVAAGDTIGLGEIVLNFEQNVPEGELLNENHQLQEGPGTIYRRVAEPEPAEATGDAKLVRLLREIGHTLVSSQALPEVLSRVVDVAFAAVPAERAFLMLRESADEALTARVLRHRDGTTPKNPSLSRTVVRRVMRERVAILAQDATTDPGLSATDSIVSLNIRSFMCAPLWNRDDVVGVLYVDSPRRSRFGPADLDAFAALANAAAVAIEQARLAAQLLQEQRRRERLQRYHSPAVVSRILQSEGQDGEMRAQEREVTVMFCDLVGFTTICEQLAPGETAALLNAFLTRMTDVVFEHEGTLDKFLGDALLAVFGAPLDQPDHAQKAVEAALAMRRALVELNARQEGPALEMRIAISTGVAIAGDIGSPRRREFTVLGDVVNTAARIEDELAGPGQIVVSGQTWDRVKDHVKGRTMGSRTLRGRAGVLDFYEIEPPVPA